MGTLAKAVLTIIAILAPSFCMAADAPSCGAPPCRASGIPYTSEDGGVIIVPGEPLLVELKIEGGAIVGVVPHPELLSVEVQSRGNMETHVIKPHPDAAKIPYAVTFHLLGGVRDQTLTWQHKLDRPIAFNAVALSPQRTPLPVKSCQLGQHGWTQWTGPFDAVELRAFRRPVVVLRPTH